jgi:hypothetical protein
MSSKVTLLPNYIGIVQNTSLDFYQKSTNLLSAVGNYLAELQENIKFNKSLVTTNMLSSYGVLYNELNATDFTVPNYTASNGSVSEAGTKSLDNSFKLFFIEKYLSLSKQYRSKIDAIITNNQYFTNFSDDIGYIADTRSIMDNNVNPYFDVFNQQNLLAQNVPSTINTKISRGEKIMLQTFSYYTDTLLKLNLIGLQTGNINDNTAATAHGTNLITDILYYKRAQANQQFFLTSIQVILGDISNFILFFKDINPRDQDPERTAILSRYTITNLEGLQIKVDVLKNKLSTLSLSTQQVLGA